MSEDIAMDECRPEMLEQVQIDTKNYLEKSNRTIETVASRLLYKNKGLPCLKSTLYILM